jgi:S-DNA-T family DNA segregation ATPase FtsK/SpoIIIE
LPVGGRVDDLKRVIEDVARDIGRGAQHHLMFVENDSNPQTVRVLIPRTDREFPRLPNDPAPLGASEAGYVPLYVGKTIDGADHVSTLDSWPHLLVAGTTGSGKTTFLRSIFTQLARFGPRHVQLIMVDGKGEVDYDDLDNSILHPDFPAVVNGASRAVEVLEWCIAERERRVAAIQAAAPEYRALGLGVKQIDIYKRALETGEPNPLVRPLVIVIDEFADLMMQQGPDSRRFEDSVQRLVQVGRSSLMHLVLGTQRPDAKTLSGRIRANLGGRAIFNLPTFHDSMTALARGGAEALAGKGDMLFVSGNGQAVRLQGYNL